LINWHHKNIFYLNAVSVLWPRLYANCRDLLMLLLNKYLFWRKRNPPFYNFHGSWENNHILLLMLNRDYQNIHTPFHNCTESIRRPSQQPSNINLCKKARMYLSWTCRIFLPMAYPVIRCWKGTHCVFYYLLKAEVV